MEQDQILRVRSFNRTVTQRIGALNSSFLDRGRPLGEARLLYEIGPDGRDVRVLREKLALDSGYLSRLLRSLERQKLVHRRRGTNDGRGRYVEPTRTGLDELAEYERRSDAFARSLLLPLSSDLAKASDRRSYSANSSRPVRVGSTYRPRPSFVPRRM